MSPQRRSIAFVGLLALGPALACASAAQQRAEDMHQVTRELATTLVAHHAYDTAIPLLRQAIAHEPRSASLRRSLGVVLRDRGLYAQARDELMLALRLGPQDPETLSALGMLQDLTGDSLSAERWHRQALARDTDRAEFCNNLGFSLYLQGGRDDEAVRLFEDALHRDPAATRVYNNLGFALARQGKYDLALHAFQQAGSHADALTNLGLAYALAGVRSEAQRCYLDALRLNRSQAVARQNLEALDADFAPPKAAPAPATQG